MRVSFEKLFQANDRIYWFVAFFTVSAEIILTFFSVTIGVILYSVMLLSLLITVLIKYHDTHFILKYQDTPSLYFALVLIPLIRIIGVSLPQSGIPPVFAFEAVGVPLFIAGVIVAKIVGITPAAIGFRLNKFYRQLLIALIGIPLGYLEFYTYRLTFKDVPEAPDRILIWVLTFIIFIGFLEEFLFRGLLFNIVDRYLETNKAMVFTSILYATLTISAGSFFSVLFAFLISLLFCRIFVRYKSIIGISLAHGLINITLYILCPLMTGMK